MPPPVWFLQADAGEGAVEEYGYATDVIPSDHGEEQRVQLREHPAGALEFSFLTATQEQSQILTGMLYHDQLSQWLIPLWHYARKLNVTVSAGATTLDVTTDSAPFQDPLGFGQYVLIWSTPEKYEAAELDSITGITVGVKTPGTVQGYEGLVTWVIPCRLARLVDVWQVRWETARLVSGRIRFEFDQWNPLAVAPAPGAGFLVFGDAVLPIEQ